MTTTVSGSSITFNDNTTQNTSAYGGGFAFRNRIINGDMRIDQRNAGASVTATGYNVDRWQYQASQASKFNIQQNAGSVTPPAGFNNYLGLTVSSAVTIGSGDYFFIRQYLEGYNSSDFNFGTANAQTLTISFLVRSSLTGSFGGSLINYASTRAYPFSYTISSSNTWEYKTVTITGDTSGTWIGASSSGSIGLVFSLGTGSTYSGTAGAWAGANYVSSTGATSVVGTNGATFYITGVQLEKGSTATSFDYRPYGQELALCQRYYFKLDGGVNSRLGWGHNNLTTQAVINTTFPVPMRDSPSALEQSGTASHYDINHANTVTTCSSVPTIASANKYIATTLFNVASGLTAGQGSNARIINTSAYLAWSAEL